jgi:hypothetical protein
LSRSMPLLATLRRSTSSSSRPAGPSRHCPLPAVARGR